MPKASQRLPLLQTLSSLKFINSLSSDSDSDIQEDIILLDMITSQRYINPHRRYLSQLAVALSRLGSNGNGATSGKIGMLFGISHGAIVLSTQRVIQILMKLKRKVIMWPTIEQQREMSQVMQAEGFPACIGFIDGSLIPLSKRPPNDSEAYFNCKKVKLLNFDSLFHFY
ncbi:hypothetical protein O181_056967 [Austropuccinia psidii MF-1]|uniref:Uncharacterized protein n=1 Tax=Austropuccinia psidii MF-1 TaxID=1389203 RepID=A0A9Q3EBT8_9BASI|nr:hypothetical protein [Austropuccinia psidii MF-1]